MPVNAAYTIYLFLNHHCTNSLSSLHIFVHHCTFCASLHTKTSPDPMDVNRSVPPQMMHSPHFTFYSLSLSFLKISEFGKIFPTFGKFFQFFKKNSHCIRQNF